MVRRGTAMCEGARFAFADSISFLNAADWDRVTARSGLFLSRPFLGLLERNLPENLATHYALVYMEGRPVAAVVAQSLDIRVADLSSGGRAKNSSGFWRTVGQASRRSFTRARRQVALNRQAHAGGAAVRQASRAGRHAAAASAPAPVAPAAPLEAAAAAEAGSASDQPSF